MPDIGTTTIGGSSTSFETFVFAGQVVSMPEDGYVESITFYGRDQGNGSHTLKGVLYEDDGGAPGSGAVLGETATRVLTNVDQWWTFTFDTPVFVAEGTSLRFGMAASGGGDTCYIYSDAQSQAGRQAAITWPTIPDPTNWSSSNILNSIYGTYEAATAGGVKNRSLLLGVG